MGKDNSKPARRARASKSEPPFDGKTNLSAEDAVTLAKGFVWTAINDSEDELADFLLLIRMMSESDNNTRERIYLETVGDAARFFTEVDQAVNDLLARRHVELRKQLSK